MAFVVLNGGLLTVHKGRLKSPKSLELGNRSYIHARNSVLVETIASITNLLKEPIANYTLICSGQA